MSIFKISIKELDDYLQWHIRGKNKNGAEVGLVFWGEKNEFPRIKSYICEEKNSEIPSIKSHKFMKKTPQNSNSKIKKINFKKHLKNLFF